MELNIGHELHALRRLSVPELRRRFAEVFGEPTRVGNKPWLIKRILWRLQALAEGDLSQRARQRAAELANDADLRLNPPRRSTVVANPATAPTGLPMPGTVLTRVYKGQVLQVHVLAQGFEYDGQRYKSLSAVAKAITGSHCNGLAFFGINQRGGQP